MHADCEYRSANIVTHSLAKARFLQLTGTGVWKFRGPARTYRHWRVNGVQHLRTHTGTGVCMLRGTARTYRHRRVEVPRPGAHIPARVRNDIEHTAMPSAMGGGKPKSHIISFRVGY